MQGEVAIVGYDQVAIEEEKAGLNEEKLVFDVVKGALESAGIEQEEIDTAIVAGNDVLDGRTISNTFTAESEGGFMKDETKVALGGLQAANYSVMRVLSGLHDVAVVSAYGQQHGRSMDEFTNLALDPFRLRPLGVTGVDLAALQARRYYANTKADASHGAQVAAKNLANAADNPLALGGSEVTPEDVADSGARSTPLRDLEVGRAGDGACALVLTPADVAESYTSNPAYVQGMGHATDALEPGREAFWQLQSAENAAEEAARRAGIAELAQAIDVAEIAEVYAPHELMLLEAMGLAPRGKAAGLVEEGQTERGGRLPVNPSGGAVAGHAYFATGLIRLVEAIRQVTGDAGDHQVDDARLALAHGAVGPAHQANAVNIVSDTPQGVSA